MNKKIILGIIIGLILGSVSVYAGTKMYASDVSINTPTGSNLGSDATLQNSLDELYSIADKYDELKTEINSLKNNTLTLDKIYPIGSIYISTSITTASDVAKKFGGTWETYGSGRTIIGAGTGTDSNSLSQTFKAGETGGEYKHTLTISEMPSHNHNVLTVANNTSTGSNQALYYNWSNIVGTTGLLSSTTVNGGSKSHNNIQPYITVYMYKRVK